MKDSLRSVSLRVAAILLLLTFALPTFAETPREELVHAYFRLKFADHDYNGHRAVAMKEIEVAGRELGLVLRGDGPGGERQFKSDEHLAEARRLLRHARENLEKRDRDRVAARVDKAIREIDAALGSTVVVAPPAPAIRVETPTVVVPSIRIETPVVVAPSVRVETPVRLETPREELVHAYILLKGADHDYADHRIRAMREIEAAGKDLGLVLKGDGSGNERQFKSDERLAEARRLLAHAREKLEDRDRVRVAARVDRAIAEINSALKVK